MGSLDSFGVEERWRRFASVRLWIRICYDSKQYKNITKPFVSILVSKFSCLGFSILLYGRLGRPITMKRGFSFPKRD